jgi:chromosome segregation ATPase
MKDMHRKELEDLELRLGDEKFQIMDLEGKVESLQTQLAEKIEELAEKDRMIAEIEAKDYEKKYKSLILEENFRKNHPEEQEVALLFGGNILRDEPDCKLFLKQTI